MLPPVLPKYAFRIKTRVGLVINNLMIHGRDPARHIGNCARCIVTAR